MTFAQIAAIVGLLLAFGAPVEVTTQVQSILQASVPTQASAQELPVVEPVTQSAPMSPLTLEVTPESNKTTLQVSSSTDGIFTNKGKVDYVYLDVHLADPNFSLGDLDFSIQTPQQTFDVKGWQGDKTTHDDTVAYPYAAIATGTQTIVVSASENGQNVQQRIVLLETPQK